MTNNLLGEVIKFRNQKVSRLGNINRGWNITLTVAGLTLTALTTVLGVVESGKYQGWIKFGIALFGSSAVAAQSASRKFQVRGKSGTYTLIEAELVILEQQILRVKDENEVKKSQEDFDALVLKTAQAEAQRDETEGGN